MDQADQGAKQVTPPVGMYACKLDDRSRLKLPADLQKMFEEMGEKTLFATSLDHRIARLYAMSVWRENEKLLNRFPESRVGSNLIFTAYDLGGTIDIDSQGRIVFPQKLREAIKMDGQNVYLYAWKGHIEVLNEAEYTARKEQAKPTLQADLEKATDAGLL